MTERQRLVRFRHLVPASSPEPIFSPTDKESSAPVLHSIFSPSNYQQETNGRNVLFLSLTQQHQVGDQEENVESLQSTKDNVSDAETVGAGNFPVNSRSESPTLPATNLSGYESQLHTTTPIAKERSHRTPRSRKSQTFNDISQILVSPTHTAISSLAVSMDASLQSSAANKSVKSASIAFKTIEKMEWLKLESILACESVPQLIRIISVLDNEEKYPALLKAARTRLNALRAGILPQLPGNNSPNSVLAVAETSLDLSMQTTAENCTAVKHSPAPVSVQSSLVMSISTDDEDEEKVAVNHPANNASFWSLAPRTDNEKRLFEQVRRLEQTIIEMEQLQVQSTDELARRINDAKATKETEIEMERRIVGEQTDTDELLQRIQALQERNHRLQQEIDLEMAERAHAHEQSAALEQRMAHHIQQLQDELRKEQSSSKVAHRVFQRKDFELNRMLKTAKANLGKMKADRDAMLQCLLDATGRPGGMEQGVSGRHPHCSICPLILRNCSFLLLSGTFV
jgi:hypothetical protein